MTRESNESKSSTTSINFQDMAFDEWRTLFEQDPEKFEKCRQQALNELIDSAPERMQNRLQGLKFQMEAESVRSKSGLAYHMRLSAMMMESLESLREQVQGLVSDVKQTPEQPQVKESATILSFDKSK